jgi:type II secretory pathway pseudopilin PulG
MFLPDDTYQADTLYDYLLESPVSKSAIAFFSEVYRTAKGFVAPAIFATLRPKIENIAGMSLNLRSKVDKARFGRILTISELTYRGHSLEGFKPLHLLEDAPQQLEMDFSSNDGESKDHACDNGNYRELQQQRDRAQEQAKQAKQRLQEFERFTQLLLLGKIFHQPADLNGLEQAPLLKVFGSPTTLDKLHENFKTLRAKHHPDQSPFQAKEAADRFNWLKQAYSMLVENWVRFSPTNQDIPRDRVSKLQSQQLTWNPESFWYWKG